MITREKIKINRQLKQAGVSSGLEYYNPNPWVRILDRANETEIEIDEKISKPLIDSGAMISMISKGYCDKHRYEIQPLELDGFHRRQYRSRCFLFGLCKVRMQIPGISSFDQDVLMLISHTTTHYDRWVSIQVGSQIIDQVINCITEEELQSLSRSWKLAYVSTIILKSSQGK